MLPKIVKLTSLLIGIVGLNLGSTNQALSFVLFLQDGTPQNVTRWEGSGDSALINIGGETISSGDINFELDSSKSNTILFDFNIRTITLDINLLINSPLLQSIGEPPAPINLVEIATLPDFTIINSNNSPQPINMQFISEGTITQPFFAPQDTFLVGSGTIGIATEPYLIVDIDEAEFPLLFNGGGIIESGILNGFIYENDSSKELLPTPEPSPILGLFGLGLWAIVSNWKKRTSIKD